MIMFLRSRSTSYRFTSSVLCTAQRMFYLVGVLRIDLRAASYVQHNVKHCRYTQPPPERIV